MVNSDDGDDHHQKEEKEEGIATSNDTPPGVNDDKNSKEKSCSKSEEEEDNVINSKEEERDKTKEEEEEDDDEMVRRMMDIQDEKEENETSVNNNEAAAVAAVGNEDNNAQDIIPQEEEEEEAAAAVAGPPPPIPLPFQQQQPPQPMSLSTKIKFHYTKLSLLSALLLLIYSLRTRQQYFLAMTFLSSSKLGYIVLGNAVVALVVWTFYFLADVFLGGLRIIETESIGESIRWNVTETCIALTIFRSEVDVAMGGMFLVLVLGKCLHWAVELRGSHIRMTEEVFYFSSEEGNGNGRAGNHDEVLSRVIPYYDLIQTKLRNIPRIRFSHVKYVILVQLLAVADICAIGHCAYTVHQNGPSVHILFGFEAAILLVTAFSSLASFELHVWDGIITLLHNALSEGHHDDVEDGAAPPPPPAVAAAAENNNNNNTSLPTKLMKQITHSWRDRRATFSFSIELLAQSATFLFYLLFFAIVFTYYGMPLNIFREVYVSYQNLRKRLSAFVSYRRLTSNMDTRFESISDEEELERVGKVCIICRDVMDIYGGAKKLPGCGHVFHRHCLREWLVQQQSCPTCRADIQAGEARVRSERRRREQEQQQQQQQQDEDEEGGGGDDNAGGEAKQEEEPVSSSARSPAPSNSQNSNNTPCLCRVTSSTGAVVYTFQNDDKDDTDNNNNNNAIDQNTIGTHARIVPNGKIIYCTETTSKQFLDSDQGCFLTKIMMRMPDGWVDERDLDRIMSVTTK